jgi:hypothetical protein
VCCASQPEATVNCRSNPRDYRNYQSNPATLPKPIHHHQQSQRHVMLSGLLHCLRVSAPEAKAQLSFGIARDRDDSPQEYEKKYRDRLYVVSHWMLECRGRKTVRQDGRHQRGNDRIPGNRRRAGCAWYLSTPVPRVCKMRAVRLEFKAFGGRS